MPYWARVLIGHANRLKPTPGFTEEDMMTVWERCEGRCAVSGLEFSEALVGTGRAKRPYAPSPRPHRQIERLRTGQRSPGDCGGQLCHERLGPRARARPGEGYGLEVRGGGQRPCGSGLACRQDARIAEAEREAAQLVGETQKQARRHIAALKRARRRGWLSLCRRKFARRRSRQPLPTVPLDVDEVSRSTLRLNVLRVGWCRYYEGASPPVCSAPRQPLARGSRGDSDHGLRAVYPCSHQLQAPLPARARARSFACRRARVGRSCRAERSNCSGWPGYSAGAGLGHQRGRR